jgi:hypothetical protein
MTIVVEDGSEVTGANSYVTLDEARDYASARGVTLPAADSELEPLAHLAMDFLKAYDARYVGNLMTSTQPLPWPRKNAYINGFLFANDDIPSQIKEAQKLLIMVQHQGATLFAPLTATTSGTVKREKVGPIETEYAEPYYGGEVRDVAIIRALDMVLNAITRPVSLNVYRA